MMSSSGSADFLVSYTAEDRDWAEWIASHLGALGYAYVLQDPPSGPGLDPFHAADAAVAAGQDVIVILSYAFIDSLRASGAADRGHLQGPGRAISVQIEPLEPPPDLAALPSARMHEAADDYGTSRDLLVEAVRVARPEPQAAPDRTAARRLAGLPAPVALAEAYPVPAPPSDAPTVGPHGTTADPADASRSGIAAGITAGIAAGMSTSANGTSTGDDAGPGRSVGLLGFDRSSSGPEPGVDGTEGGFAAPTEPADATEAPETAAPSGFAESAQAAEPAQAAGPAEVTEAAEFAEADAGPGDRRPLAVAVAEASATAPAERAIDLTGSDEGRKHLAQPRPPRSWDRAAELAQLATALATAATSPNAPTSIVALVGPPGVGKTCLALEHATRHLGALDTVWWVRAGTRAGAVADLQRLAARLEVAGPGAAPAAVTRALHEALAATTKPWLVIFDGWASGSEMADLLPRAGRGQVLLTSANRRLGLEADVVEVDPFDEATAAAFLLDRTGRTDTAAATRVAQRVGGLPVALELAAAHATATGTSFDTYLQALDDPATPGLATNPPVAAVESAVLVALRAMSELSPASIGGLAALCAGTADAPLPHGLVNALGVEGEPPLVDVLSSYGLAVADGRSVAVPSAVRQAAGYLLADLPVEQSRQAAASRLIGALDQAVDEADGAAVGRAPDGAPDDRAPDGAPEGGLDVLGPHAVAATTGLAPAVPGPAAARLAAAAARWVGGRDAAREAVVVGEQNLDLHEHVLGPHDPATRAARRQLAGLYRAAGDTTRALATEAAVLADDEAELGTAHPRVVQACATLAHSYHAAGDHGHAVHYGERAVTGLTALHGADHPDTRAAAALLEESRREATSAGEDGTVTFVPPASGLGSDPATTSEAPDSTDGPDGSSNGDQHEADLDASAPPPAVFVSAPPGEADDAAEADEADDAAEADRADGGGRRGDQRGRGGR